jgi:hypothetical protein
VATARAFGLVVGVLLVTCGASAEEWHEAYRAGVQALALREPDRAVASLRRAIALRPEPGRNVVTYGTNVEARYFPYLRLAEAYLALGQLDHAGEALEKSTQWNREPAEERQQLQARLASAVEARRPPPSTSPPRESPTPPQATPPAALPAETPTPSPPGPSPSASAPPSTPRPVLPSPSPESRPIRPETRPAATPIPVAAPSPGPEPSVASSGIEIVSDPPGALAYVDDEPLGATDPQSGRLVKSVASGRHHVRVSLSGHADVMREIEVPTGGRASFYATLKALTPARGLEGGTLAFGVVALALLAAITWMVLRRPAQPAPLWAATPRPLPSVPGGASPTPSGNVNPGARTDELGQEWFGDFRLLDMLGRGGMASVYKAERGGELSALKRPLGGLLDDSDFVERFLREADIGRTLNHPNIVRILGRGHVDRVPYFNMELLTGRTLQGLIEGWGAGEPRTAVSVVAQVAEALDFAHSKGVVHRDLKPSNIMLLLDGTAKVMDFGIARARRFEGITATGAFLGTPEYVAPEVIEGGASEPRSDLYSLGIVFYELLTGQRPFVAETPFAVLKKQCSEEPRPPSQLQPRVPAQLEAIVLGLLAKEPKRRPASSEALVVMLRDWLNHAT